MEYKEKATNATNIRRFDYKSNNLKCNMYIDFLLYQIFLILSINSYLFQTQKHTNYSNFIRRIIAPFSQNWQS